MKYVNIELGRREVRVNSATLKDGRLDVRCCARSRMDAVYVNGSFCIDTDGIVATAVKGLREAGQVDAVTLTGFTGALVVLGENGQMLMPCRALSDPLFDNVEGAPDERRLFDEGGLVPDSRSALYQLLAIRKEEAPLFERARCVMFLIDYIRYRLTGNRACDYSLVQASGLTLAGRREWNAKLFEDLGLVNLFPALAPADTVLGALSDEIVKEVGYEAQVLSTPANPVELAAYVLKPHMAVTGWLGGRIALFNEGAILSDEVYEARGKNITLEDGGNVLLLPFGGYGIIDRLKRQSVDGTTFDTIEDAARENKVFEYIDIRDERLMHGSVVDAVNAILDEQDKENVDRDVAIGLLYNSIARYTSGSMRLLDEINEAWCPEVYVLGQASRDQYLNSLMAMHGSRTVIASAGFNSSTFAFLSRMLKGGECTHEVVMSIVRNTSGLSTFRRMEDRQS